METEARKRNIAKQDRYLPVLLIPRLLRVVHRPTCKKKNKKTIEKLIIITETFFVFTGPQCHVQKERKTQQLLR